MIDLKQFLNSQDIALYINKLPADTTVDEALFPYDKQISMEIEEAEENETRVQVLKVSQFDTAAKKRALSAKLDITKHDMPFFKESIGINEKQRRDIVQALQSGNQNLVKALLSKVFNNYADLVNGAMVQMKRMRAQLIQNGKISIVTDDGNVKMDYKIPTNHKADLSRDAAKKWTNEDADIVNDIIKWQKVFVDEGKEKPTRLIMTETTFQSTIMVNKAIKTDLSNRALSANVGTSLLITESEFLTYLKNRFDVSVAFVKGAFINEAGATVNYYEDGKITFIPTGTLGKSMYSYTPEEYDKSFGSSKLDTSVVKGAVAITTMVKEDPVTVDTKVSMIGMPQLTRGKSIFLATVY